MSIIAREVEFSPGDEPQIYHAVEQADYVSIVAVTLTGNCPSCGNIVPQSKVSHGNCQRAWLTLEMPQLTPVAASGLKRQDCVRAPFTPFRTKLALSDASIIAFTTSLSKPATALLDSGRNQD